MAAPTILVLPVPGHNVPMKDPGVALVMGRWVACGLDGTPRTETPTEVTDTLYIQECIASGALTLVEPTKPDAEKVEPAKAEPKVSEPRARAPRPAE